jgi:hypothetical protein
MTKLTTLMFCCVAVAVAATGAVTLDAQSADTTIKSEATSPPSSPVVTAPRPRISPQQHLTDARGVLAGVSDKSLPSQTQKGFSQLLKDVSTLESSYAGAQPQTAAWQLPFYDVERDLVLLIGGGGPSPTPADAAKATPALPAEVLDSAIRVNLQAFRTHIELFYDAATTREPGGAPQPSTVQ